MKQPAHQCLGGGATRLSAMRPSDVKLYVSVRGGFLNLIGGCLPIRAFGCRGAVWRRRLGSPGVAASALGLTNSGGPGDG